MIDWPRTLLAARRLLVGLAALTIASPASGQQRASDADQRAIELLAAEQLATLGSFGAFALDPRLDVRGVIQFGPGGELLGLKPDVTPTTELATSRDSAHVAALMRVLGLSAVLDDATTCTVVGADMCRLGAHPGIVVFGPAWVSGERAEMSAGIWARITVPRDGVQTSRMYGSGVIVRCERTAGSGWRIVQVNRIHVHGG